MKHFVEYPLDDGGHIVIEVDQPESEGTVRAARGGKLALAKETLEEALQKVLPAAKAVVEKVKSIETDADEIEVAFGIRLNSTFSAAVRLGSAGAEFAVARRPQR